MVEVGDAVGVRSQREANVLVEALREFVVLRRNEGLELKGSTPWLDSIPKHR
jgi:hypothetical protein